MSRLRASRLGEPGEFRGRVLAAVRRIPAGRVATYGDIAELAGRPRAARAVGNIMKGCGDPGTPCHRVIGAGGALGGYGAHLQLKRELLRREGRVVVAFERFEQGVLRLEGLDPHLALTADVGVPARAASSLH